MCLLQVVFSALSTIAGAYLLFIFGHAHKVLSADKTYQATNLPAILAPLVSPAVVERAGCKLAGCERGGPPLCVAAAC